MKNLDKQVFEHDENDENDYFSDYDFETDDYVCSRCNGAGCTKCEE